ncbi:hypothetical protein ACH50_06305 [Franconibacter pulveris]|uniref:Uncharacterized protein n=1 Tax=Franconibacter pulveris TaxID=435910 RepID=A0A0J8VRF5_9ENTR|nr:hypothetical protein ACH50_06305 [Franconibacter pulveris]
MKKPRQRIFPTAFLLILLASFCTFRPLNFGHCSCFSCQSLKKETQRWLKITGVYKMIQLNDFIDYIKI